MQIWETIGCLMRMGYTVSFSIDDSDLITCRAYQTHSIIEVKAGSVRGAATKCLTLANKERTRK